MLLDIFNFIMILFFDIILIFLFKELIMLINLLFIYRILLFKDFEI